MHFHIEGCDPFDGDYPIDLKLNNRELHLIKQISGIRGGEILEAWEADDNDLLVALCIISLQRAGQQMSKLAMDRIWDADVGAISVRSDAGDEEADAGPPEKAPESDDAGSSEPSEDESSSGASSEPPSETSPEPLSPTGGNGSGESSALAPPISVS